jgi:Uma2 family endonuclease
MAEPQLRRMTQDEFFDWQERQEKNYELVDGFPVLPLKMMTGASRAHDRVVTNIIRHLGNQLHGGPCWPTTDDLAVRIPVGNIRRPDVTIECGQGSRRDTSIREPRVVIEVLSPSTMSFDRIRKLREYQTIDSLAHILLIDTEAPRVDLLSRTPDGAWNQTQHDGMNAGIELPAIGASLMLADIFDGVDFANPPTR